MEIAFYAPLKPPHHEVPSGDRHMARALTRALQLSGHQVSLVSDLRSYLSAPAADAIRRLRRAATEEISRISALWQRTGPPDLFFCYHPYYRSPDLIGPPLCRLHAVPYVTAEASYAAKRDRTDWGPLQDAVIVGARQAALNLCFTERDREGLVRHLEPAQLALLAPFIDPAPDLPRAAGSASGCRLITVAMMRQSNKRDSYLMLARVLNRLVDRSWTLDVVGDGPAREEIQAAFGALPANRVTWHGLLSPDDVPDLLARADLFVWPGCDEAYGLVYLEAQAVGLPVVGQDSGGVSRVVRHGGTGVLTPAGDEVALAAAVANLLDDRVLRRRMGREASRFVREERSLAVAARRIDGLLRASVPAGTR